MDLLRRCLSVFISTVLFPMTPAHKRGTPTLPIFLVWCGRQEQFKSRDTFATRGTMRVGANGTPLSI